MLDSPARRAGFSDPVSLTFCPYVVFRPYRTNRGHPRLTPSRACPRSPVFQFQTDPSSSRQLFRNIGARRPVDTRLLPLWGVSRQAPFLDGRSSRHDRSFATLGAWTSSSGVGSFVPDSTMLYPSRPSRLGGTIWPRTGPSCHRKPIGVKAGQGFEEIRILVDYIFIEKQRISLYYSALSDFFS